MQDVPLLLQRLPFASMPIGKHTCGVSLISVSLRACILPEKDCQDILDECVNNSRLREMCWRLLTRRMPLSKKLARRIEGGSVAPPCVIRACHTSCSRSVTCRLPPWSVFPTSPWWALSIARSTASMGPRRRRLSQIASSLPGVSMLYPRAMTVMPARFQRPQ